LFGYIKRQQSHAISLPAVAWEYSISPLT